MCSPNFLCGTYLYFFQTRLETFDSDIIQSSLFFFYTKENYDRNYINPNKGMCRSDIDDLENNIL